MLQGCFHSWMQPFLFLKNLDFRNKQKDDYPVIFYCMINRSHVKLNESMLSALTDFQSASSQSKLSAKSFFNIFKSFNWYNKSEIQLTHTSGFLCTRFTTKITVVFSTSPRESPPFCPWRYLQNLIIQARKPRAGRVLAAFQHHFFVHIIGC